MDFKSYLKTSAKEINHELENFFNKWSKEIQKTNPEILYLNQHFINACSGGKRLRGTLVKFGFELTNKKYNPEILKPAIAYEIFQTAILAHDDIIDQSPLRRGKPTIYKALGGDHYGISQTICLGDIGFFLAYKIISESNFPDHEKNLAIASFSNSMLDTGLGEMLDVELPHSNKKISEDDILTILHLKTAMYTITGPLSLGVILGGADKILLKKIADFGHNLGVAFQIQDDILGIFGTEETIGKSVTSDIEEGKLTLLILYAQRNSNKEQKRILKKYYGNGKIKEEELKQIQQIFIETGALEYSQKMASELVSKAKKMIPKITKDSSCVNILEEMADFLVSRNK